MNTPHSGNVQSDATHTDVRLDICSSSRVSQTIQVRRKSCTISKLEHESARGDFNFITIALYAPGDSFLCHSCITYRLNIQRSVSLVELCLGSEVGLSM